MQWAPKGGAWRSVLLAAHIFQAWNFPILSSPLFPSFHQWQFILLQSCCFFSPAQCGLRPVCTPPSVDSSQCALCLMWSREFSMYFVSRAQCGIMTLSCLYCIVKLLHSFYLNLNQNFRYLCCSAVLMKSCRFIRLIPILFYQYILDIVLQIVLNDTFWWFSEIIYHSRAKKKM